MKEKSLDAEWSGFESKPSKSGLLVILLDHKIKKQVSLLNGSCFECPLVRSPL
jgi:hypothetical protein